MFAIASETGSIIDDRIQYDIFGVKLYPEVDVKEILSYMNKLDILKNKMSILSRLLSINEKKSVFSKKTDPDDKYDLSLEWEYIKELELELSTFRGMDKYFGYDYNEMLDTARRYFPIKGGYFPSNLNISVRLLSDLDLLHIFNFRIVRTTEKKVVLGHPRISAGKGYGNISLAKYNSLLLMLLANKTYYEDHGIKTPIIVDGVERKNIGWKKQRVILSPIEESDPYVLKKSL